MTMYRKFNRKKRLASRETLAELNLAELAERVQYTGSPYHKRNPGDFGLKPPAQPRLNKSLCDVAGIFTRSRALRYLREGIRRGTVCGRVDQHGWPGYVWAVTEDGTPLEAIRDGAGSYHGHPMPAEEQLADDIKAFWRRGI